MLRRSRGKIVEGLRRGGRGNSRGAAEEVEGMSRRWVNRREGKEIANGRREKSGMAGERRSSSGIAAGLRRKYKSSRKDEEDKQSVEDDIRGFAEELQRRKREEQVFNKDTGVNINREG